MAKPAFKLIEKVFHEAFALPPEKRTAFLDEACAGDADLRPPWRICCAMPDRTI